MNNVVDIRQWRQNNGFLSSYRSVCEWSFLLSAEASAAMPKIERAKSLTKALEYYSKWLRRYHESKCGIDMAVRELGRHVVKQEEQEAYIEIVGMFQFIHNRVTGPHPWLSVPHLKRTAFNAWSILEDVEEGLNHVLKLYPSQGETAA